MTEGPELLIFIQLACAEVVSRSGLCEEWVQKGVYLLWSRLAIYMAGRG